MDRVRVAKQRKIYVQAKTIAPLARCEAAHSANIRLRYGPVIEYIGFLADCHRT